MSIEYGYGKAAATVMQVAGYLGPDDIPIEIVNQGDPILETKDLPDCLKNELGQNEIIEILTKFSLFQCYEDDSECVLSVHRLVQEVIRTDLGEDTDAENILNSILVDAIRLINGAFKSVISPEVILKAIADMSLSLLQWNKVANHCNHLLEHIGAHFKQFPNSEEKISIRKEFVDILHSLQVYHSIHRRQRMALNCQEHLLKIIPKLNLSAEEVNEIVSNKNVKFPLYNEHRDLLISRIKCQMPQETFTEGRNEEAVRLIWR